MNFGLSQSVDSAPTNNLIDRVSQQFVNQHTASRLGKWVWDCRTIMSYTPILLELRRVPYNHPCLLFLQWVTPSRHLLVAHAKRAMPLSMTKSGNPTGHNMVACNAVAKQIPRQRMR